MTNNETRLNTPEHALNEYYEARAEATARYSQETTEEDTADRLATELRTMSLGVHAGVLMLEGLYKHLTQPPTSELAEDAEATAYSPAQAAAHLGVSVATLRRWDNSGKVESYRTPGNHRRFTTEALEAVKKSN